MDGTKNTNRTPRALKSNGKVKLGNVQAPVSLKNGTTINFSSSPAPVALKDNGNVKLGQSFKPAPLNTRP